MEDDLIAAEVVGRLGLHFEAAAKTGFLAGLMEAIKRRTTACPTPAEGWDVPPAKFVASAAQALNVTAPDERERLERLFRFVFLCGFGGGVTLARTLLTQSGRRRERLSGQNGAPRIWAPLGEVWQVAAPEQRHMALSALVGWEGPAAAFPSRWRGSPGQADLLVFFPASGQVRAHTLVVLEIGMEALPLQDITDPEGYLTAFRRLTLLRHSREMFARLQADLQTVFTPAASLGEHLYAFSGPDKPFAKLCQASSYATEFIRRTTAAGDRAPWDVVIAALSLTGESVLTYQWQPDRKNPYHDLALTLGRAYREAIEPRDAGHLTELCAAARRKFRRYAPPALRRAFAASDPDAGLRPQVFRERITTTPPDALIDEATFDAAAGGLSPAAAAAARARFQRAGKTMDLRTAHGALIGAVLDRLPPGAVQVLCLEGSPGVGKTTSVIAALPRDGDNWLFGYFSARLAINQHVLDALRGLAPTLTCNSKIIDHRQLFEEKAREWKARAGAFRSQPPAERFGPVLVSGWDAAACAARSTDAVRFYPHDWACDLEQQAPTRKMRKHSVSDRVEKTEPYIAPPVLPTLLAGVQQALVGHDDSGLPRVGRLAFIAAIQGFRAANLADRRTVSLPGFAGFWKGPHERLARLRRTLTEHPWRIVLMVDEISGDERGPLFAVHLALWAQEALVAALSDAPGPHRPAVAVVWSDASLSHPRAMLQLLHDAQGEGQTRFSAPGKLYVAQAETARPLAVVSGEIAYDLTRKTIAPLDSGTGVAYANKSDKWATTHILANAFPGSELDLQIQTFDLSGKNLSETAEMTAQIVAAELDALSHHEQAIFFAQDKLMLNLVSQALAEQRRLKVWKETAAEPADALILNSDELNSTSVRKKLGDARFRDGLKLILTTSSGSRGVSFPRAARIIALMPGFNAAANLAELVQLLYRGRGRDHTGHSLERCRRRLLVLLPVWEEEDTELTEPERQRRRLRREIDRFSSFLLIRGVIRSRLLGAAGLRPEGETDLALTPVGRSALHEPPPLQAYDLFRFIKDAERHRADAQYAGLVQAANQLAQHIGRRWEFTPREGPEAERRGWPVLERRLGDQTRPWLELVQKSELFPDAVQFLGCITVTACRQSEDVFKIHSDEEAAVRRFVALVRQIAELPYATMYTLRQAAALVGEIFRRCPETRAETRSIIRQLSVPLYLLRPVCPPEARRAPTDPEHDAFWRLLRVYLEPGDVFGPALPYYEHSPFLVAGRSPCEHRTGHGDRWYLSQSFNLLNLIL